MQKTKPSDVAKMFRGKAMEKRYEARVMEREAQQWDAAASDLERMLPDKKLENGIVYACPECDKEFDTAEECRTHIPSHKEYKPEYHGNSHDAELG